jgi:hypothetical protein
MIDKNEIIRLFDYKEGNLHWKIKSSNGIKIGKKCGSIDKNGYVIISFKKQRYRAHRLIFMMFNGYVPDVIDHINGNRSDNRIENLREATAVQNMQNTRISKLNKSGVKNVHWMKDRKKWKVSLKVNKTIVDIGSFKDLELAELVAIEAREKFHQQFARHC